jgi:uncharacterized protein (TIGR00255 family)
VLRSMTGFGRAQCEGEWGSLAVEISSVNHRFQEVSVRLPREVAHAEHALQQRVRQAFRRGKAQLRVELRLALTAKSALVNEEVFEVYVRKINALRTSLDLPGEFRWESLLALPGVVGSAVDAQDTSDEAIQEALRSTLDDALAQWNAMRRTEGEHLEEDVRGHLRLFEERIDLIERRWPEMRDNAFRSMVERVTLLAVECGPLPDQGRLLQEMALLSDRWDIAEEISRSRSHLEKFRQILDGEEGSGKKLDFLLQEMNREINTIASKVADAELRWVAVEAKSDLERLREQIQNAE